MNFAVTSITPNLAQKQPVIFLKTITVFICLLWKLELVKMSKIVVFAFFNLTVSSAFLASFIPNELPQIYWKHVTKPRRAQIVTPLKVEKEQSVWNIQGPTITEPKIPERIHIIV